MSEPKTKKARAPKAEKKEKPAKSEKSEKKKKQAGQELDTPSRHIRAQSTLCSLCFPLITVRLVFSPRSSSRSNVFPTMVSWVSSLGPVARRTRKWSATPTPRLPCAARAQTKKVTLSQLQFLSFI